MKTMKDKEYHRPKAANEIRLLMLDQETEKEHQCQNTDIWLKYINCNTQKRYNTAFNLRGIS